MALKEQYMKDSGLSLLSEQLNCAINEIEKTLDTFESYEYLSAFMKCSLFYLRAIKKEAENRESVDLDFKNYLNSIFRTFFSECIWACKNDIENIFAEQKPNEFRYFSDLLKFIDDNNKLYPHLKAHLPFLWDIYHLRNLAQHHSMQKVKEISEKLKDKKLKKLVLFDDPTFSHVKLHPDLFKEVVERLKKLIDRMS